MRIRGYEKNKPIVGVIDWLIIASAVVQVIFSVLLTAFDNYDFGEVMFFNLYVLWLLLICFTIFNNLNRHFLLFAFYACFFIFLMGQKVVKYIEGVAFYTTHTFVLTTLTPDQYCIFNNAIYLSLLFSYLGYRLFRQYRLPSDKQMEIPRLNPYEQVNRKNNVFILKVVTVVTFACAVVMQLMIVLAKKDLSYTEGYTVNIDVPTIFKIGNYLFMGMVLLLLSSNPTKWERITALLMFFVVQGGVQLLQGRRIMVAQTALFIVWYAFTFSKAYKREFRYINLVKIIFLGVGLMVLFYFVEAMRSESGGSAGGLLGMLKDFITSTGGSDSTIANVIDKGDLFPKSAIEHVFSPLKEAFTNNAVFKKVLSLFGVATPESVGQGVEYLKQTDSFEHWLSYIVSPELYVSGHGMGSSYVAEVWFVSGLGGVAVAGLCLGAIIGRISTVNLQSKKVYLSAIALFFAYKLTGFPRSGLLSWFSDFIYLMASFVLFKVFSYLFNFPPRVVKRGNVAEQTPAVEGGSNE